MTRWLSVGGEVPSAVHRLGPSRALVNRAIAWMAASRDRDFQDDGTAHIQKFQAIIADAHQGDIAYGALFVDGAVDGLHPGIDE